MTKKYKVLKQNEFRSGAYSLVPYRADDLFLIKSWRNAQMDVLRQNKVLSDEDQTRYFDEHIKPSFDQEQPKIILFSFLFESECIGYGGLTNIDWDSKRAEVSFLLDTNRIHDNELYEKDFGHFLELLKYVAFNDLGFHRLFTETYDFREFHIKILEKAGFKKEGIMIDHVIVGGKYTNSIIHGLIN